MCTNIKVGHSHIGKIGVFKQQQIYNYSHEQNRKKIKDDIVDLFKSEQAGIGNGSNSTRMVYCVEQVGSEIVYLKRPAPLNKGFDFEIHTKHYQFGGRVKSRPRHLDMINILQSIKQSNYVLFQSIQSAIDSIYHCDDSVINSFKGQVLNGLDISVLLYLIKWLFIEQDITYWSFSGRAMLFDGLRNV